MEDKSKGLDRRQFILAGSAGLVAAAVASPTFAAVADGAAPLSLSFGYWLGSQRMARMKDWGASMPWTDLKVVDAASLPQGDPEFFRTSAKVSIYGRPARTIANWETVTVDAIFRAGDYGSEVPAPYHAWTGRRGSSGETSPSVGFTMPVQQEGLRFAVSADRRPAGRGRAVRPVTTGGAAVQSAEITLSVSGDAPKLLRGVYFLAIAEAPVAWDNFAFVLSKGAQPTRELVERTLFGDKLASFDYIVFTVEQANLI